MATVTSPILLDSTGQGIISSLEDIKTAIQNGGGGGGTSNYEQLTNLPLVNDVQLIGNKSLSDLGIVIPVNLSDLTNDSGFITNAVNDLVNYYVKDDTYTKTEINNLISSFSRFISVSELPTEDISTTAIYLVPKTKSKTSNVKDEYINLDGTIDGWEKIGDTEVDLSDYVTTTELSTALAGKVNADDLGSLASKSSASGTYTPSGSIIRAEDTTATVKSITSVGTLPTLTVDENEILIFSQGTLPTSGDVSVVSVVGASTFSGTETTITVG